MDRAKFAVVGLLAGLLALPALAGQKTAPAQNTNQQNTNQSASASGGINRTPWFSNQDIRSKLNLNEQQFNALNKAYGEAYSKYSTGSGQFGNNLSAEERARKTQELQGTFNQSMNRAVEETITDPQQRQRYNQLYLQYQGYGAFDDPALQQKLNLTDAQRQQLRQFQDEWNAQMQTYSRDRARDTDRTRWNEMRKQYGDRLNSVLNEQQRQTWRQMTGEPFNFSPDVYIQNGGTSNRQNGGTTNKQNGGTTNRP
jgi:hypothetical protein